MKTKFNIYLWDDNSKGWKYFKSVDDKELKSRKISIGDGVSIGDGASIGDGEKPNTIYIIGSKHSVSYWGEDRIDIGCQSRKINEWLSDCDDLAKKQNYGKKEIFEYKKYINFIKNVHEEKCNTGIKK